MECAILIAVKKITKPVTMNALSVLMTAQGT
jgi:hypothetical protein